MRKNIARTDTVRAAPPSFGEHVFSAKTVSPTPTSIDRTLLSIELRNGASRANQPVRFLTNDLSCHADALIAEMPTHSAAFELG